MAGSFDAVADAARGEVRTTLGGDDAVLLLREPGTDEWRPCGCHSGTHASFVAAGIEERCIAHHGAALTVPEIVGDALPPGDWSRHHLAQLQVEGRVFGLLAMIRRGPLDEEELELFCGLASTAAVAIAQLRARDAAAEEATKRERLSRYFSPQVADRLASGEAQLEAGRVDATVLFSDIRGFTALSDERDAAEVLSLLNAYFDAILPLVFRHGGVVDKLIGDGLMAVFGIGPDVDRHPSRALACAVDMVEAARSLDFRDAGLSRVRIGVGIHSGPVVVGDLGSEGFFDFTVLGSTVNLAARVEALTKEHKAEILVTDAVRQRVGGELDLSPVGEVKVRGVAAPQLIHRWSSSQPED